MKQTGLTLIMDERYEQIEKHGYTISSDLKFNGKGQLVQAARRLISVDDGYYPRPPENWDSKIWSRMCGKSKIERLAIAAALLAAEIDRLKSIES